MQSSEIRRRQRIATAVMLITALCMLCAAVLTLTRGEGRIAFATAQLVARTEAVSAWK